MARILISDHLSERRDILCTFLRADEHTIVPVARESEAVKSLRELHPDLIILEGNVGGAKVITEAHELDKNIGIIMMMATPPTVDQLVELMKQGVSDVLVSPLDISDVQTKVERALNRRPLGEAMEVRFHDLVGSSRKMQEVFRAMVKAAATDNPVMIIGERGTGKRLVAEQIHRMSARKDRLFRVAHCAGLSPAEIESELFGHESGAFSWAVEGQAGALEEGDGGVLCLEDICELGPALQAKLLRFLESAQLRRMGGARPLTADVRILACTPIGIRQRVEQGQFRSDLYYRLSSSLIELPPLQARAGDIPEMIEIFLSRYEIQIAGEAIEVLMNYSWPGNVAELKNAIDQAITSCDGNRIELRNLPSRVLRAVAAGDRRHKYIPRMKAAE